MSLIKKNDIVIVIQGKEKGKKSKVLRLLPKDQKVIIEGLNLIKRHTKKRRQQDQAGIIKKEAPMHISNVMLYCSRCKKPVRVGLVKKNDIKKRICKKCNQEI